MENHEAGSSLSKRFKRLTPFYTFLFLTFFTMLVHLVFSPEPSTLFRLILQIVTFVFLLGAFISMALSNEKGERKIIQVIIHLGMALFAVKFIFLADGSSDLALFLHFLSNICILTVLLLNKFSS